MSRAATPASLEVRVDSLVPLADGVVELSLVDLHGAPLRTWEPGAHVDLRLPGDVTRQYSLTSDPADTSVYRVAVLHVPEGRGGSAYIHRELSKGDVLHCDGPRNNFAFLAAPMYRFVAGGIGITPLLSMIEAAVRSGASWNLTYLGRTAASMAWAEELQHRYPGRVEVRPDDIHGQPDVARLLDGLAEGELVYACGPSGLLDAIVSHLGPSGAGRLHLERFAPTGVGALTAQGESFTVRLDRSGLELVVPAGKSILEVMEERGIPVISSCREGTCGTCETQVLAGEVEHRDSILSDAERAANDTMMICCSRGIGYGLVIDA
ncbi:oxidoreductase [Nocardioides sp. BGMRC 2183]|nr:oxidoreductase [Nocardioides sp. BGMRC 2183]